jgi:hypothetical protein
MGASTDELSAAPFPIPAHQTGRAQLRHPAFRLASPQTHERGSALVRLSCSTANSPNTALMLKRLVPGLHLVTPPQEMPYALINVVVNRLASRCPGSVAEVRRPAPQNLIQPVPRFPP